MPRATTALTNKFLLNKIKVRITFIQKQTRINSLLDSFHIFVSISRYIFLITNLGT